MLRRRRSSAHVRLDSLGDLLNAVVRQYVFHQRLHFDDCIVVCIEAASDAHERVTSELAQSVPERASRQLRDRLSSVNEPFTQLSDRDVAPVFLRG